MFIYVLPLLLTSTKDTHNFFFVYGFWHHFLLSCQLFRSSFFCWKIRNLKRKDVEKSLKQNFPPKLIQETSHTTWTLNIKMWVILYTYLYRSYYEFEFHVVRLVFFFSVSQCTPIFVFYCFVFSSMRRCKQFGFNGYSGADTTRS